MALGVVSERPERRRAQRLGDHAPRHAGDRRRQHACRSPSTTCRPAASGCACSTRRCRTCGRARPSPCCVSIREGGGETNEAIALVLRRAATRRSGPVLRHGVHPAHAAAIQADRQPALSGLRRCSSASAPAAAQAKNVLVGSLRFLLWSLRYSLRATRLALVRKQGGSGLRAGCRRGGSARLQFREPQHGDAADSDDRARRRGPKPLGAPVPIDGGLRHRCRSSRDEHLAMRRLALPASAGRPAPDRGRERERAGRAAAQPGGGLRRARRSGGPSCQRRRRSSPMACRVSMRSIRISAGCRRASTCCASRARRASREWPVYLTTAQAAAPVAAAGRLHQRRLGDGRRPPASPSASTTSTSARSPSPRPSSRRGRASTCRSVCCSRATTPSASASSQRHRVDCTLDGTYELWTQVYPGMTGLAFLGGAKGFETFADIAAVNPDADGVDQIRIRTGESVHLGHDAAHAAGRRSRSRWRAPPSTPSSISTRRRGRGRA